MYGSITGATVALCRIRSRLVNAGVAPRPGNSTLSRLVSFRVCSPSCHCPPLPRASRAASSSVVGAAQLAAPVQLAAGASRTSSFVRPDLTDRGWSSGSQPATAASSCFLSSSQSRPLPAVAHEHEATAQLLAIEVEVQVAGLDRGQRVVGLGDRPRAPVPDDHVTAAVLAGRDHAFEVEVVERVVLDVDRHPPHVRIERRTLRHGPAHQHPGGLQAEVVVQPAGPMALDHEPMSVGGGRGAARGLRGDGEVALGPVPLEPLARRVGRGCGLRALAGGHVPPLPAGRWARTV